MAKQMVEDASFTKSFKGSAFWMVGGSKEVGGVLGDHTRLFKGSAY